MKRLVLENLEKALQEFNRYRSPEAIAQLISRTNRSFTIKFTGPYCTTCGFYDYFDDLKILLEDFGINSNIVHP